MISDPRKARTLGEACDNGDGTYDGFRLLSWLTEVVHPGKGATPEQVRAVWEDVKAKKAVRK